MHERDEWGDPSVSIMADYIRSYSPYENIGEQAAFSRSRPDVYVLSSLNDHHVDPGQAHKWVASIRKHWMTADQIGAIGKSYRAASGVVYHRVLESAGHSGPRTLKDIYNERALEIAFLLKAITKKR